MAVNDNPRTSAGLRDTLFDAIQKVLGGEMLADQAKAIALLAREICGTVELEIEVNKLRSEYPADMKLTIPGVLTLSEKSAPKK